MKLLTVDRRRQAHPELIDREAWVGNKHRAQPLVVSITQSTELGTLTRRQDPAPSPIRAPVADEPAPRRRTDANAPAALDLPLARIHPDAGVDMLSLGGTKNSTLGAEAIVVLNPAHPRPHYTWTQHAAHLERYVRVGPSCRPARRATCGCGTPPRQRDGGPPARSGRGRYADGSINGVTFTADPGKRSFATLPDCVPDRLGTFRF